MTRYCLILSSMFIASVISGMLYAQFFDSFRSKKFLKLFLYSIGLTVVAGFCFTLMNDFQQKLIPIDFVKSIAFYGGMVIALPVVFFIVFSLFLHPFLGCKPAIGNNVLAYALLSVIAFLLPLIFVKGVIMTDPPNFFVLLFGVCACSPVIIILFVVKNFKKSLA